MNPKESGLNRVEGLLHELYRLSGAEPGKNAAEMDGEGRRRYRRSFRPKFWVKEREEALAER